MAIKVTVVSDNKNRISINNQNRTSIRTVAVTPSLSTTARDHANAAFAQANTARDHANSALSQANTARTHANTAHLTANAALPNTSGATFNGILNITNNVTTQGLNVTSNVINFGSAMSILPNGMIMIYGDINMLT